MKEGQMKADNFQVSLKSLTFSGEESKLAQKHYLFVDDLVYYLSSVDDDPCMRLFVPIHLEAYVIFMITMFIREVRKLLSLSSRNIIGQICLRKLISMFQKVLFVKLDRYKK